METARSSSAREPLSAALCVSSMSQRLFRHWFRTYPQFRDLVLSTYCIVSVFLLSKTLLKKKF